ncbi:DUF881 domain-containing protein [Oerskovia sp. NPDC056781]|uniref:DUF881 domain-containing protein n=1 Tax=Oerskovia sp. NPDC056781 TaxID=3345942 RepID=UPI00366CA224
MTTDSTPSGPADPENPEAAPPHEADVAAGETERLDEDAAVPPGLPADADETSPGEPREPDAVDAVAEVPGTPNAAQPDAPPAPVVPPVDPAEHDDAGDAAPGAGRAEGTPDGRPSTVGSTVETPEARETDDMASVPAPVTAGSGHSRTESDVPRDVADQPGDGGEPATVDASAPGALPTEGQTQGAPTVTDVGLGADAGTEPPAPSPTATSPLSDPDRPHGRHEATGGSPTVPAGAGTGSSGGWAKLGRAMRPTVTRSQLLAGLLCALLGFALAVQVSQTQEQQLSSLRQSDLVRLLDDVTQRANDLESRVQGLQDTRDELSSGSGQQRAALELAQRQSQTQGILSGRLPAEGPGITLTITETDQRIPASKLFNILEELRNAGVEVVEVNGIRLVTSSYFEETSRGMVVDGQRISSPYQWQAIGDPSTLETALEIPGGAMSSVRNEGANPKITQEDLITISSTREPEAPEFATPVPAEGGN